MPGVNRSVLQERDRIPLAGEPGNGFRLMVDVMSEFGSRARVATWQLDVKRTGAAGAPNEWTIANQERISSVENIYRVSLNGAKQFAAHDLKIAAEDLDLTLAEGSVFIAEIDSGATAVILLGKGTLNFHPSPATEKGQVKIFCGSETLETRFDTAYIRVNPADFEAFFTASALEPVAVDPREPEARAGHLSRGGVEVVRDRPRRSQPRAVDAAARPGRLSRGDAHAPLRHPDLRALGDRTRGHHAVRPQAPSQHRALRVEGEAGAARAVLQRRRPRRLRHPRLRHRRGGHARPPVDRRPRAHPAQGAVVRARDADLQAGGSARRPVDRQLPVRPALRHPGEEPEHAGREPADAAWQGQRAHADDHLCRTARTADARPRSARPARAGPGAQPRRSAADDVRRSRARSTAAAASGIRRRR